MEVEIVKPRTDKREYRRIVLPNSLEALLISDPETDKVIDNLILTTRDVDFFFVDCRYCGFLIYSCLLFRLPLLWTSQSVRSVILRGWRVWLIFLVSSVQILCLILSIIDIFIQSVLYYCVN